MERKMSSLTKDKAKLLIRRQSTIVNSKIAGTKGGQAALDILLGAYGGEDEKEDGPAAAEGTENMPEIPNSMRKYSFGTKMGTNVFFPKK